MGWEEISLSGGFDSSEIQRSSLLRDHRIATSPLNETGWWDLSHSNEDR